MEYYNKIVINGVEYPLETVIVAGGAPTSSTAANVGQLYANTADEFELYICTAKTAGGATTWKKAVTRMTSTDINSVVNAIH